MHKMNEVAAAALAGLLFDTIAAGGVGLCDIPENLIAAIHCVEQRTILTA